MDNEIDINGERYVKIHNTKTNMDGLPYVIVRARDAGCHCGYLLARDDANGVADLVDSRRMWRWYGRTLSGLAIEGTPDKTKCKFGPLLPKITIRGWCEIIPCTDIAAESLANVEDWKNE